VIPRAIGRAAAAALLAGLLGAAFAALFYAWHPDLRVEFDRDLPRSVAGIYPVERDEATGLTFAWTGADSVIRLPGLDVADGDALRRAPLDEGLGRQFGPIVDAHAGGAAVEPDQLVEHADHAGARNRRPDLDREALPELIRRLMVASARAAT